MSTDNMTAKVAVVGTGYWGKNLVRNYHELGALALICDPDPKALERMAGLYPGLDTTSDFNEVLSRKDIPGVVLATPAETHYDLASRALMAGKHVYVEKPLALDDKDGTELVGLSERKGLILMVGHLLQYHPMFVRLKELAGTGELGRINYIYSHRLNLGKIRREENILWSFAPHDVSMILALAGEGPDEVWATGAGYLQRFVADVTTTHLHFPSGLRAHIFVSWLHPFKEQKLVVVGKRKMAVFDDTKPWAEKLLLYPHKISQEEQSGDWIPQKADAEPEVVPEAEPLKEECRHFLDCMTKDTKPITDGREGLAVLKVLNQSTTFIDPSAVKDISKSDPAALVRAHSGAQPHSLIVDEPEFFAHPSAVVDEGVSIGTGCKIWHFSHVLRGSTLGADCNLGQNVVVGPEVSIGSGCKIQNNVSVYQGVTLEDHVFCGPSMVFTNVHNPRAAIRRMDEIRLTLVRSGASLGANCTIVCGNTIGRHAFVGAGAVVTKDVPDHALVAGNPAKPLGWMCACGVRLAQDLTCPQCQAAYQKGPEGLKPLKK